MKNYITKEEAQRLLEYCVNSHQKRVCQLLSEGLSSKQVREELGYSSQGGVSNIIHRVRSYAAKKGFDSRAQLDDEILGLNIKGVSDFKDMETGEVTRRWIKYDQDKEKAYEVVKNALLDIAKDIKPLRPSTHPSDRPTDETLMNVYISNDLHFGALMYEEETSDKDYDLEIADNTLESAMDYLVTNSPHTKDCIILDLGDMTEMDDYKNATPKSGNALDVTGRYSKVLATVVKAMIKLIERALLKHDKVYFINVEGNHDITTALAVRIAVDAYFAKEPRVVVDSSPKSIKYFLHGSTLLGFAHGDGLKMHGAGETMAVDNEGLFSSTKNRYFHFGHTHKDAVHDGKLCRSESHRNIAPLNHWASANGYRRQLGTAKCITYCEEYGEVSRTIFNVDMVPQGKKK